MGSQVSRFVAQLETFVRQHPKVTGFNLGKPGWFRGRPGIKITNGNPGHLRVEIREKEAKRHLHVYTADCKGVSHEICQFARTQGVGTI